MSTHFNPSSQSLIEPVVFRSDFNAQPEAMNPNQAWSLFLTAGRKDQILGRDIEVGRLFTDSLVLAVIARIGWILLFDQIPS